LSSLTELTGVSFEHMTKFNRLKQMSEDVKVLAEAMKKSESGLVEVSW